MFIQVDKAQYERVLGYIEQGKAEGATVLTGGKPCGKKGYYIEPTIFTNVKVKIENKLTFRIYHEHTMCLHSLISDDSLAILNDRTTWSSRGRRSSAPSCA